MCNHKACFLITWLSFVFAITLARAESPQSGLALTSPVFAANARIPVRFTCSGDNISPPLVWSGVPSTAETVVLIVKDPDAPSGDFVHWVIFNLPATLNQLPKGIPPGPNGAAAAQAGASRASQIAGASGILALAE